MATSSGRETLLRYFKTLNLCQNPSHSHITVKSEHTDTIHIFLDSVRLTLSEENPEEMPINPAVREVFRSYKSRNTII